MNMFDYDIGRKCLIAEAWCPTFAVPQVRVAIQRASVRAVLFPGRIQQRLHAPARL